MSLELPNLEPLVIQRFTCSFDDIYCDVNVKDVQALFERGLNSKYDTH